MWARVRLPASSAAAAVGGALAAVHGDGATLWKRSKRTTWAVALCDSAGGSASWRECFVTYNVLCNHLIHAGFRKRCAAEDLESDVRLRRVKAKLSLPTAQRAIVGLQEVSLEWAGDLHVFFARQGYHVVFAPYGEKFNGHMGVLLAYPSERYETEAIRLHHIGDALPETLSLAPTPPPYLSPHGILSERGMADICGIHKDALDLRSRYAPRGPTVEVLNPRQDREWGLAGRRQNIAVLARLRPRDGPPGSFCVGVYHMPCLFGSTEHRQTQSIHLLALRGALADLRATPGEPCVLIGDFNLRPGGSGYDLLTGASLGSVDAPDTDSYRRIYNELPFTSAYCAFHGAEPSPWMLDYIWLSPGCSVRCCPKIDAQAPRPSATEPSDHPILEALVELPLEAVESLGLRYQDPAGRTAATASSPGGASEVRA